MRARRAFDDIEDEGDHTAEDAAGPQMARLRVRRTLELPLDGYDALVASALLDEHGSSDWTRRVHGRAPHRRGHGATGTEGRWCMPYKGGTELTEGPLSRGRRSRDSW